MIIFFILGTILVALPDLYSSYLFNVLYVGSRLPLHNQNDSIWPLILRLII